ITFFIDINVIVAGLICMCGSAISVRLPITVRSHFIRESDLVICFADHPHCGLGGQIPALSG
ncbi:MAG: hypothetical protein ACKOQ2_23205, partial [Dolichospermum sp.]